MRKSLPSNTPLKNTHPDKDYFRELIQKEKKPEKIRELREEERMEMVRNRRSNYEQRRNRNTVKGNYQDNVREFRKDNSVEGRIRDEGLRDA